MLQLYFLLLLCHTHTSPLHWPWSMTHQCLGILICQWIFMNVWSNGINIGFHFLECLGWYAGFGQSLFFIDNTNVWGEGATTKQHISHMYRTPDRQLHDDLQVKPFWVMAHLRALRLARHRQRRLLEARHMTGLSQREQGRGAGVKVRGPLLDGDITQVFTSGVQQEVAVC